MTTAQAIAERKKAEKRVAKVLQDLERETGLKVAGIDFDQETQSDFGKPKIVVSEIRIRLEA